MHVELARIKLSKGDYDVGQQMEIIASEILRLDRVVKTFLDFTRPVEMKTAEVAVDGFVSEIVELARPQAQAVGVTVSAALNAPGATMVVDSDLLKQATLNIVVNAIEAMPQGGELRFESAVEGEEVELRISDSGPGIPAEKREKIFQLYFTTKKKGSGIGLAMTFRIVQLHNGKIDFFSEPGKGTTFVLRFPLDENRELRMRNEQPIADVEHRRAHVVHAHDQLRRGLHLLCDARDDVAAFDDVFLLLGRRIFREQNLHVDRA